MVGCSHSYGNYFSASRNKTEMTLFSHANHPRQLEKPRLVGSAYVYGPLSPRLTGHRTIFDDVEYMPGYGNDNVTDDIWADSDSDKDMDTETGSTHSCGTIHQDVQVII